MGMWNLEDIKRVNIWEFLEDVDKEIFTVSYNYYGVLLLLANRLHGFLILVMKHILYGV